MHLFLRTQSALHVVALLAELDYFLDFGVAAQERVVDHVRKIGFEGGSPLLDEFGIVIGLGPEMRLGERG